LGNPSATPRVFHGSTKYFTGPARRRAKTVRPWRDRPPAWDAFARSFSLSKRIGWVLIARRISGMQHRTRAFFLQRDYLENIRERL
jgi:hypothetical protein